ncbi:uncharacterized protein LOC113360478 [Papaver somniferum]|uniref:uncharacterized protein LOC113360478 n=1 Tax=Papaver somniferum TaxID=3469 RepID=UPI000E7015A1|nr:uncharacterized protein LOC113360478 [Papaver somniferum]
MSLSTSASTSPPRKMHRLNEVYERCNYCTVEPENFEEASKEAVWIKSMEEEVVVINDNDTWEKVARPSDKEVIGVKWIYKVKYNADETVQRYKERLVAKGYLQQPGIDYKETFAPVARLDTIRSVISMDSQKGWLLYQLDDKSVFLNGELHEDVYVEQP